MMTNPYFRSALVATRNGVPDPRLVVDTWIDNLDAAFVCTSTGPPFEAIAAYDLLSAWTKLLRVRPELQNDVQHLVAKVKSVLEERGGELAGLAMTIPDPAAWSEEARQLDASYEEDWLPDERSRFAERLLTDLDDAELVCLTAARLGKRGTALEKELEGCRAWCLHHADLFLAASVHVQAVGATLIPDLLEQDPGLALTALKYEAVMNAAEEVEAELGMEAVEPLPAAVVRPLVRRFLEQRAAIAADLQKFVFVANALVQRIRHRPMARARDEGEPKSQSWEWAGPGGHHARLTISLDPVEAERVALAIIGPDHQRATDLAGQPVVLNGVESLVDKSGKAVFQLLPLLESTPSLSLFVGADPIEWERLPTT
ncbi:MAG: hypothetical protein HYX68_16960 [Planctomycetes bacterium]|nr:hypothetical protein [Planctomycetota bacterium]